MADLNKVVLRWKEIIIITFLSRAFLFLISTLTLHPSNIFYPWVQWDGPHYIDIAKNWYQSSGEQALWIVFSPFYPILIKIFNFVINDFSISAIIVSIVFSFLASIMLFELTLLDFEKKIALFAVWFLNIFPTSYFLQASYTESLFLTLSMATVYLFRKKFYIHSGIFGMLASLTRINGILLLPVLLMETKSIKKSLVSFIMLPLGILFYLIINYLTFSDPLYFRKPLATNWHKQLQWPWISIQSTINYLPPINHPGFYINFSELAFVAFSLFSGLYIFLKIRKSYGVYILINFLFFSSSGYIMSTPRYVLVLFPLFIMMGKIKNKIILTIISLLSIILLIYYTNFYIRGQWAF